MAQLTKEFWFSSDTEGWTAEPLSGAGQNVSMGWYRRKGSYQSTRPFAPIAKLKGALRTTVKDDSPSGGGGLWRFVSSWEGLGVPAGKSVWRASGSFLSRWDTRRMGSGGSGSGGRGPVENKLYFGVPNAISGPLSVLNHVDQVAIADLAESVAAPERSATNEWKQYPVGGMFDPVSLAPSAWQLSNGTPTQVRSGYGDSTHSIDLTLSSTLPATSAFDSTNLFAFFLRLRQNGVNVTLDYSSLETLTIQSVATNDAWTLSAGADKVAAVHAPDDDATSYVSATTGVSQDFNLTNPTGIGSGDLIDMIRVRVRAQRGTPSATTLRVYLNDNLGSQIQAFPISSTWTTYERDFEFKSDGFSHWTKADVDALVVGLTRQLGTCRVSTVEVDVFYTPTGAVAVDLATGTEAHTIVAALSSAETAAAIEAHAIAATNTKTDTGSGADSHALTTTATRSETVAGVEAHALTVTSPAGDSGAATDAHALAVTSSGADTGQGTDAHALAVTSSGAEFSIGAETHSLVATSSASEPATSADAHSLVASSTGSDTGAGADLHALTAQSSVAETAAAIEAHAIAATLAGVETGAGIDASSIVAALAGNDSGFGTETPALTTSTPAADTGAAIENIGLTVSLTVQDAGAALESGLIQAALVAQETGATLDAHSVNASLSFFDIGAGAEASALVAALTLNEAGAGGETHALVAVVAVADNAVALDDESLGLSVGETAAGVDASHASNRTRRGESGARVTNQHNSTHQTNGPHNSVRTLK
jgi:hypothetical protein